MVSSAAESTGLSMVSCSPRHMTAERSLTTPSRPSSPSYTLLNPHSQPSPRAPSFSTAFAHPRPKSSLPSSPESSPASHRELWPPAAPTQRRVRTSILSYSRTLGSRVLSNPSPRASGAKKATRCPTTRRQRRAPILYVVPLLLLPFFVRRDQDLR